MSRVLCISATFLDNRYHGEEWPPSPARLFQALVAGAMGGRNHAEWPRLEPALRWLETRPAPEIRTRGEQRGAEYRIAVPNNDMDSVAAEWAAGRHADPSKIRTMKTLRPMHLPDPSPHVLYLWPLRDDEDADSTLELVRPLSHCLHTLGWGIDVAFADSHIGDPDHEHGWTHWRPAAVGGVPLKIPIPGFLDDLQSAWRRFRARSSGAGVDSDTRATIYRIQHYAVDNELAPLAIAFGLRSLDGEEVFSRPWADAMIVASWMRHVAGVALESEQFGESLESYVYGHSANSDDASHRMSFVPLPTVDATYGDGRIRRIMFVEPKGTAARALQLLELKLAGRTLIDEQEGDCALVSPLADNRVFRLYTERSTEWHSVTPVVLHGFNTRHGSISQAKTEALLYRAFEMAGHARQSIESVVIQRAPLWKGAGSASTIRLPKHLVQYPRYHVAVRFFQPVRGPILAGLGRHYGIGVFAAAR